MGTGKSITAAAYYMQKEAPRDVYVITTAKKRDSVDWEREFAKFGVGKEKDATLAGVLTVESWNNIGRFRDVEGAFFIFDEQRVVGSGQWANVFIKIAQKNRWILLSATPGDTWMDYVPVFIANGFYRNRTEFKRDHVVYAPYSKFPKIDHYVGIGRLVRLRNDILVEMPYTHHTESHPVDITVGYDHELFMKVLNERWHVYENRPIRNVAELFLVMRKVVNSDISRLQAVRQLLSVHPRLIVFYNFDFELELLRGLGRELVEQSILEKMNPDSTSPSSESEEPPWQTLPLAGTKSYRLPTATDTLPNILDASAVIPTSKIQVSSTTNSGNTNLKTDVSSTFQVAEWNGHKHQPIPKTDSWLYLVQYVAGAEGWDCITTDTTVFYSLPYSYKVWYQAHGRTRRLNTPFLDLFYYTLKSASFIDRAIADCLSYKKNFNESAVGKLLAGDLED
jgi:hypothetical protein